MPGAHAAGSPEPGVPGRAPGARWEEYSGELEMFCESLKGHNRLEGWCGAKAGSRCQQQPAAHRPRSLPNSSVSKCSCNRKENFARKN